MDPAVFEEWMMTGLVSILIIFMGFIVWDLAKKSKAGRFGSFILFFRAGPRCGRVRHQERGDRPDRVRSVISALALPSTGPDRALRSSSRRS